MMQSSHRVLRVLESQHGLLHVPAADRWPAQVQEAFGFLEDLGFRVLANESYRLGDRTLFGLGEAGIKIDCDGDTHSLAVTLVHLDDGQLPVHWWEPRVPRVTLRLREVAELLAPQSLAGESTLPPLEREADRAPHLRFWALVLRTTAADWLHGDQTWFGRVERQLRDHDGASA